MLFSGLWNAKFRLTFPDNATCENVRSNGLTPTIINGLVGNSVTRTYGETSAGDQTTNWRLSLNNEAVVAYTDFPSGISNDPLGHLAQGGMTMTFNAPTVRTLKINGIHLVAFQANGGSFYNSDGSVNWQSISPFNQSFKVTWDDTIDTPDTNDVEIIGYGVGKQVTRLNIYTQFNFPQTIGKTTLLGGPLVFNDPACCWPTVGAIRTNFKRTHHGTGPKWQSEDLVFQEPCGSVNYITYTQPDGGGTNKTLATQLNHCH